MTLEEEHYEMVREKIADILYWAERRKQSPGAYQTKEFGLSKHERQILYKEEIDQILKEVYVPHPDQSLPIHHWENEDMIRAWDICQKDMSDFKRVIIREEKND